MPDGARPTPHRHQPRRIAATTAPRRDTSARPGRSRKRATDGPRVPLGPGSHDRSSWPWAEQDRPGARNGRGARSLARHPGGAPLVSASAPTSIASATVREPSG
ncbi:MAG: hypothetical protein AVDCRST_MAG49-1196 [uncultured Thermomicrobiales bacterium]|uniref:Uncharacterized protein n=1 Tax=uncultured Thermomicrobiales bacterium TaxID=1645740 RepID=A0A6J4UAX3_9BACT|nr:MAG: hypothetical protein AVDCRST_MAG49-1196 [uncultured Thermomicrobiales bacterium]